jgi:hypothetical protein
MVLTFAMLLFAAPLHTQRVPVVLTDGAAELRLGAGAAGEFIRLEVEGAMPAKVWVNGSEVAKSAGAAEWDLSGFFRPGGANQLRVEGTAGALTLVHGPRVYIAAQTVSGNVATVSVRNTLDNTANVDVEAELTTSGGEAQHALRSITVPPGVTMPVDFPMTLAGKDWRLKTVITKHAEAVEGDYDVEETVTPK